MPHLNTTAGRAVKGRGAVDVPKNRRSMLPERPGLVNTLMVRRRVSGVSNHEAPMVASPFETRLTPLLRVGEIAGRRGP